MCRARGRVPIPLETTLARICRLQSRLSPSLPAKPAGALRPVCAWLLPLASSLSGVEDAAAAAAEPPSFNFGVGPPSPHPAWVRVLAGGARLCRGGIPNATSGAQGLAEGEGEAGGRSAQSEERPG